MTLSVRPRLLDLFCGAGGAARGYQMAGFYVVGVDCKPQPRYAGDEFIQADVFDWCDSQTNQAFDFQAVHASPPCQAYSIMRNLPWLRDKDYPRLIDKTQDCMQVMGVPYVLENVMGAHLPAGWLCGGMFGMPFYRHRAFETNWFWLLPGHPLHPDNIGVRNGRTLGPAPRGSVHNGARRVGANVGHAAGVGDAREAMGIDWMTRDELTQAIPPAYTEYIGRALMAAL